MIMKMVKAMSNRSRTAVCPNTQYQYSERVALPENTAYLEITDLAAVSRLYPLKADACVAFMPDVSRRGSGMSIPYPEERFI